MWKRFAANFGRLFMNLAFEAVYSVDSEAKCSIIILFFSKKKLKMRIFFTLMHIYAHSIVNNNIIILE